MTTAERLREENLKEDADVVKNLLVLEIEMDKIIKATKLSGEEKEQLKGKK